MPLLEKAGRVEVVGVTPDLTGEALGSELARQLSRHSVKASVTDLPLRYADAGRTLMDHLVGMRPSLLVMGAFAHSALFQHVIGGTTSLMLTDAKVPVLYAY
jgi:nucleotide-binding universal stress UspA family protein